MSENNDYKAVDLLVIITRLHANLESREDEFKHDWILPDGTLQHANVLRYKTGFWMLSNDGKVALMVIHGYNGLLVKTEGAFQDKVLEFIREIGLDKKGFSRLAVFAHGQIPETEAELGREKKEKPLLTDALEAAFASVLSNFYTTDGNVPVALALPRMLRDAGIGETLRKMVASGLKLEPAVDAAVRSMQHILLEMRLWCDLWFSKKKDYDQKTSGDNVGLKDKAELRRLSAEVKSCIDCLNNSDHWKGHALQNLPTIMDKQKSLRQFLCQEEDTGWLGSFFENSDLAQISDRARMDLFLRDCSSRLEQLIVDAAEQDKRRSAS